MENLQTIWVQGTNLISQQQQMLVAKNAKAKKRTFVFYEGPPYANGTIHIGHALNKILKSKHQLVIDGGYGKLKGKTFRISNMGDETVATIGSLIGALDESMKSL